MKKSCLFIGYVLLMPGSTFAQEVAKDTNVPGAIPEQFFNPSFYILGMLFFIMFITIVVLTRVLMKLVRAQIPVIEQEEKVIAAESKKDELTAWARFDRKFLTKAVPVEREKEILSDHVYDGIQELDNDLPPWWKYGFYITIIWAFCYLVYYHVTDSGALSIQEYKNEMAEADAAAKERSLKNANNVNAESVVALDDAEAISLGQTIFSQNCIACHGQKGEGGVGPNLTDEYWLHGGGIKNIFKTVVDGVPAKGMIAWKSQLSPKQIQQVSSFIITLQGTKPGNGKEPQGEVWKEETAAPADTVNASAAKEAANEVSMK